MPRKKKGEESKAPTAVAEVSPETEARVKASAKKAKPAAEELLVKCNREALAKALASAARLAGGKTYSLPQTSHVLLEVKAPAKEYGPGKPEHGEMVLLVNTLDIALEQSVYAAVEGVGRLTVPARVFSDYVSELQGSVVTLRQKGRQLYIECDRDEATMSTALAEDFPPIPTLGDEAVAMTLEPTQLADSIFRVEFAASHDEARPILRGVLFDVGEEEITLVTADGFRLAKTVMPVDDLDPGELKQFVVPARALRELHKPLAAQEEPLTLLVDSGRNLAQFELESARLVCTLVMGTYPNWRSLIPSEATTVVEVNGGEMMKAARITSVFSAGGSGVVRMRFVPGVDDKPGKVLVKSRSEEIGEHHGELDAKVEGEGLMVGVMDRYLADALSVAGRGSETVVIEGTSPSAPLRFHTPSDRGFEIVQMPMFITWDEES